MSGERRGIDAVDELHMQRAIRLAKLGTGATYPNPSVGAVVARRERMVAFGRSAATGGPHAEVVALKRAGRAARGATLYVTLEPCPHHGLTPPCVEAIVAHGIRRVVIGTRDPAPHVGGRGVRQLRAQGIEVVEGVNAAGCRMVHEHYLHHVRTGLPFVTLKIAMSLDGRIATPSGHSRWITGTTARRFGHRLRAEHHAIAVGAETVVLDDPRLDVRLVRGTNPIPVVFDSGLRLVSRSSVPKVLRTGALILHTARASAAARRRVVDRGAEAIELPEDEHHGVSFAAALAELGRRNIRSLLVEGGGRLHATAFASDAWQRIYVLQAPRLLGEGRSFLPGIVWPRVEDAPPLVVQERRRLGEDFLTVLVPATRERRGSTRAPSGRRTRKR